MKILLLEGVIVNYGDDRGGVAEAAGALVDPVASVAHALVTQGRALYTVKADDPSKGLRTAPADIVKAAVAMAKKPAKAQEAGQVPAETDTSGEGGSSE